MLPWGGGHPGGTARGRSGREQLGVCPRPCPRWRPSACLPRSRPGARILLHLPVEPRVTAGWVPAGERGLGGSGAWEACATCQAGCTRCPAPCTEHHSSVGTGGLLGAVTSAGCRRVPADGCSSGVSTGAAFHLAVHWDWREVTLDEVGKPTVNGTGRSQRARHSQACEG